CVAGRRRAKRSPWGRRGRTRSPACTSSPARGRRSIRTPSPPSASGLRGRRSGCPPPSAASIFPPPMPETVMDKLVSLAKRRGFVFQSSEIYGGLGSVWDYGPLGVEHKKNIKERWWRSMVHEREDIEGVDAEILMHPKVWEASGHVARVSDALVHCK